MSELPLSQAVRVWAYVGLNSFGGPAGQIAVMHREIVENRQWLSERRFVHALNYCMVLPGPEAMQLATYVGWLLNGVAGGLVAGLLFILPGVFVMFGLSALYVTFGQVTWVSGLLFGVQAAVVVIVVQALIRIAGRTLHTGFLVAIAVAGFLALYVFAIPFPLVIVAAGFLGWLVGRSAPGRLPGFDDDDVADESVSAPRRRSAHIAAAVCLVAWLAPVLGLMVLLGGSHVLTQEALLFSKLAVVTFGGAYAALAYVSQVAVYDYGWLTTADMATGLGLAETTPGPLVLVLQFVGFLGAYHDPGTWPPMLAAACGSLVAVWATFVPCFMFIFAGAPYVEALRHSPAVHHALSGISAAVVGVIANLALWFAMSTFFTTRMVVSGPVRMTVPEPGSVDLVALGIALAAVLLIFVRRWPTLAVLAVCAAIGMAARVSGLG